MRTALTFIATAFLVACFVDTTGISETSTRPPKGNPDAAILVEEYADLQCPACKASLETVAKPLLEKYGEAVRFEFKHFPLRSIHPFALEAAEASECAADQNKFWEFHDIVYAEQSSLSSAQLRAWADELGLNTELFERCIKSKIKREIVIGEFQAGRDLGVSGTPTYFVNGQRVESTLEDLSAVIDQLLGQANLPL